MGLRSILISCRLPVARNWTIVVPPLAGILAVATRAELALAHARSGSCGIPRREARRLQEETDNFSGRFRDGSGGLAAMTAAARNNNVKEITNQTRLFDAPTSSKSLSAPNRSLGSGTNKAKHAKDPLGSTFSYDVPLWELFRWIPLQDGWDLPEPGFGPNTIAGATKMALTIPVAWRDATQRGLSGVVEIHASDFANNQFEDASVREFIALVNEKIREATSNMRVVREVKEMLLHGARVSSKQSLEYTIPDVMGSSPRFLATMRVQPSGHNGTPMLVFVKLLSGKTIAVECTSADTVGFVKDRIEEKEGVPTDNQRLTHVGTQLQDHIRLSRYGIQCSSTLYLAVRMLGGFAGRMAPYRTFADVSDGSIITAVDFSPTAPEWRLCDKGLNIEGRCMNRDCRAFRHMIIDRKKFEFFNLIRDDNVRCPICRVKVKPATCGLYDCSWRFEGVKADDGMSICSPWKEAKGYVYHRFDADETSGSVEWASLVIMVKPMNEAVAARLMFSTESVGVSEGDTCSIYKVNYDGRHLRMQQHSKFS
ncbi:hypothetical protein ON010_g11945 [Phytophthora cinnamomi]|nr:hypothetical protein ON010_g11945 [Phytophthora cinnamomi]